MSRAFVLMTALPPTRGHLQLASFASKLGDGAVVILCTQPDEPFAHERAAALRAAALRIGNIEFYHLHRQIEQNPAAPGFWEMWKSILESYGLTQNDYIVASEHYGAKLAEVTSTKFMQYDIAREINPIHGTQVREAPNRFFNWIAPEFQKYLRQTVTFIGAESVGKTTLSKTISNLHGGYWFPEWARPYLEDNKVDTITVPVMNDIHEGQRALQDSARDFFTDRPWVFQDTDLYATLGYWQFWDYKSLPDELRMDAEQRKSDLYIIPRSNIPYEYDPIRYGKGERESSDEYWIALCENNNLNFRVLESDGLTDRIVEVRHILDDHWKRNVVDRLQYKRLY